MIVSSMSTICSYDSKQVFQRDAVGATDPFGEDVRREEVGFKDATTLDFSLSNLKQ